MLSFPQIDNICRRAANLSHTWKYSAQPVNTILDFYHIDLFTNLYYTGLRFHELQDYSRWSFDDDLNLTCNTLKGSDNRKFEPGYLTPYFENCILNSIPPYPMCLYSTANRYLKKAIYPMILQLEKATLTTHIFRHNFAKRLDAQSISLESIQTQMGEVSPTNTSGYINSIISSV